MYVEGFQTKLGMWKNVRARMEGHAGVRELSKWDGIDEQGIEMIWACS